MVSPARCGDWLAPPPSPRRAHPLPRHDEPRVRTSNWPPARTQIWPPAGTFSWPRTGDLVIVEVLPGQRSGSLRLPSFAVADGRLHYQQGTVVVTTQAGHGGR